MQLTTPQPNLFNLTPKNLSEAIEYAKLIAESGMVPKSFQGRPQDVLVAVQMGAELGLPPTQALQNIAVINGRPSVWGDAVLAIVKASPLCEYVHESFDEASKTAVCTTKRRGDDKEVTQTFSFEDAKQAGLLGKSGPWAQYPKRMAQMRARAFAVRDAFPDLLRGIAVREEQQDIVVEKDITPQTSRTDTLLNKLKKEPEPDVEQAAVERVLDQIDRAQTEDELKQAAEQAKELDQEAQKQAREAYKIKLTELRAE